MWLLESVGSAHSSAPRTTAGSQEQITELAKRTLVSVGSGIPAISRRLWDCTRANKYVDFIDLIPACGKSKSLVHDLEGQILVVPAADLTQSRKVIPDLPICGYNVLHCTQQQSTSASLTEQPNSWPDIAAKLMARQSSQTHGQTEQPNSWPDRAAKLMA